MIFPNLTLKLQFKFYKNKLKKKLFIKTDLYYLIYLLMIPNYKGLLKDTKNSNILNSYTKSTKKLLKVLKDSSIFLMTQEVEANSQFYKKYITKNPQNQMTGILKLLKKLKKKLKTNITHNKFQINVKTKTDVGTLSPFI